uniref:Solute carrier family 23 member 3 n=1 Tax=Erpetoichthys calabaricus TaxID=27687 RepID=A0A8C4SY16_ERPCA
MEVSSSTSHQKKRNFEETRIPGFRVDQRPPWYINIPLALQHVFILSSVLVMVHSLLFKGLQQQRKDVNQYEDQFMATSLFTSGIATLMQTTLGSRLPLMQAPSLEFLIPALVLLTSNEPRHDYNGTNETWTGDEYDEKIHCMDWSRELQGAVFVSGIVRLLLGLSGFYGVISRYFSPMVVAPTLSIIGLSIYKEAALFCSASWGITAVVVLLIVLLSQHMHNLFIPSCRNATSQCITQYPVFRMFSVLLPLVCVCIVSGLLGVTRIISLENIVDASLLQHRNSSFHPPWLWVPYPGHNGLPLLTGRSLLTGIAAALSAGISSQSCYLMTARLAKTLPPPPSTYNRGLCIEGLGSTIAGMLGSISGTATSVANSCSHGLTECCSRDVVQVSAIMCLLLGISPRLTHLLTYIPFSVHGGILSITHAVAVATGITYFQYTDMDSGRNIFNIGFSLFMALLAPRWFSSHKNFISTGATSADIFFLSLLTMPVFLGGVVSFFLDNTVSGSPQERGLHSLLLEDRARECTEQESAVYDLPPVVSKLLLNRRLRVFPFCAFSTMSAAQVDQEVAISPEERTDLLLNVHSENMDTSRCDAAPSTSDC